MSWRASRRPSRPGSGMASRALALLASLGLGCSAPLILDDPSALGPYLVLSGPLDPTLELDPDTTRAAVAWAYVVDGSVGGAVVEVPLEPRLLEYAVSIDGPPEAEVGDGVTPDALALEGVSILVGVPLLYGDPDDRGPPEVAPELLLDVALDGPEALVGAPWSPAPLAVVVDHLLVGLEAGGADLSSLPAWASGGPGCRLDAVVHGLTLYRDDGGGCGSWRPLAEAGERTEFQGVAMAPPP